MGSCQRSRPSRSAFGRPRRSRQQTHPRQGLPSRPGAGKESAEPRCEFALTWLVASRQHGAADLCTQRPLCRQAWPRAPGHPAQLSSSAVAGARRIGAGRAGARVARGVALSAGGEAEAPDVRSVASSLAVEVDDASLRASLPTAVGEHHAASKRRRAFRRGASYEQCEGEQDRLVTASKPSDVSGLGFICVLEAVLRLGRGGRKCPQDGCAGLRRAWAALRCSPARRPCALRRRARGQTMGNASTAPCNDARIRVRGVGQRMGKTTGRSPQVP